MPARLSLVAALPKLKHWTEAEAARRLGVTVAELEEANSFALVVFADPDLEFPPSVPTDAQREAARDRMPKKMAEAAAQGRDRREEGAMTRPQEDLAAATDSSAVLDSVVTCPACGFTKLEVMPTDACQFFYECTGCKTVLRPETWRLLRLLLLRIGRLPAYARATRLRLPLNDDAAARGCRAGRASRDVRHVRQLHARRPQAPDAGRMGRPVGRSRRRVHSRIPSAASRQNVGFLILIQSTGLGWLGKFAGHL